MNVREFRDNLSDKASEQRRPFVVNIKPELDKYKLVLQVLQFDSMKPTFKQALL